MDARREFVENTVELWEQDANMTVRKLIGMIYDDFQRRRVVGHCGGCEMPADLCPGVPS